MSHESVHVERDPSEPELPLPRPEPEDEPRFPGF